MTAVVVQAQEPPYFVTYSHVLEEPGNLEIASQNVGAAPKNANPFYSQTLELEYGVTAWYTAEVYLQGQSTFNDSTIFTGFRLENRFRPLRSEHWINPVLYVEYEDRNGADKSFLEITGHDVISNQQVSNALLRGSVERAVEGKLILSSNFNGFNIAENIIAEKNLSNEAWEFGYAVGASHSLSSRASVKDCRFCRQYFAVGGELFGGLGTRYDFGFKGTSQYLGPTIAYNSPHNYTITAGPEFGLNRNSAGVLWRLKVAYEFFAGERRFPEDAMRRAAGVVMLGVSACLLMGAADGSWLRRVPAADHARTNPLPDQKAGAEAGSHVYASECSHCHGDRARGKGKRPALISDRVRDASDGDLAWLLKNGNAWKGMPSWSSMPDARRWQLVAYLRGINEPATTPAKPEVQGAPQ